MRLLILFLFAGCKSATLTVGDGSPSDYDEDGYKSDVDCDDFDSAVHPGAVEDCSGGKDNDCNGVVDDGENCDGTDADGDGYTLEAGDCNDADPAINPGAEEVCDGLDNDCDGTADNVAQAPFYVDADQDGYGDPDNSIVGWDCEAPDGYVLTGTDCDDADAAISPAADELCDDVDNNCDGDVDEATAIDAASWYQDADEDGYGNAAASVSVCDQPVGYVATSDDCDDASAATYPGADELCDTQDNDCDATIDEDAIDPTEWWHDRDADGYGDSGSSGIGCEPPAADYVDSAAGEDCDDYDDSVYPGAPETYGDGTDQDCNGDDDIWYITGTTFCVTDQVFDASHASCDAYMVGQYPFDPWTELQAGNLVTHGAVASGFYCYDFSVRAAGYYEFILVSACDASNPADPVDELDQSTWEYADFDDYCENFDATSPDPLAVCQTSSSYAGDTAKLHYDGATTLEGYGTL